MKFEFIGENGSLGFLKGQIYDLELTFPCNDNTIKIVSQDKICFYSNRKKFEENWKEISDFEKDKILTQKRKKEILTQKEKEYLYHVIEPVREDVIGIKKLKAIEREYIQIEMKNSDYPDYMILYAFKDNTEYTGMKLYKIYTLKELGL